MAPRKSSKDPKQPSITNFVTPSKKRREPEARSASVSPSKRARRSAPESNNNNNNNNNVQDVKKDKTKKKSDNKENAASQRNSSTPPSPSKRKKSLPAATTPKRRTRKPKADSAVSAEPQPEHILGISEHGESTAESGPNATAEHGEIIDGIIDHGEEPEIGDEVEELQRVVDAAGDGGPTAGSEDNDVIAEDSDDDYSAMVNSNGVVELSPTTATVVSPSGSSLIGSPEMSEGSSIAGHIVASDTTPERKVQVFKCKKCDQIFRNRYYMRKHMLMDHEHQLYKCRICAFTSVFPEKLKSHIIKQHVCKKEKSEALTVQTLKNENEVFEQQAPRKIIMIDGVPLGKVKKVPQCYICDVCGKVYSSKFSLERHVRCHTGERPYQCDVCEFTTSYREHMQRHMTSVHLVVHSDEPRMKYVPKNKRSKEEMEKEATALEEEASQTSPDGSPSKKRRNILRKRFECAACGMRATHKSDLVEHIKEKHPKAHIVSLDNNDGSKVHLVVTASKKPKEARKFTATCSYCSKVFHDNWKYMVHLRSHTGVKPFSCSECDFHATTKMTVRDHIHRKHSDCPEAKLILKLVNITDGSVEEVAIDVPQKEFKCELCFQIFPGNYELKTHKFKDHPEAKPFSCTMCDQKEWGKAAIIIHCSEAHPDFELETIILRNNRPTKIGPINLPKCDTCSKMFPYQSLLYLHQRTHTGERNYGCDSCDFRTDSKKALTRHILKKHLDSNLKVKPKRPRKKATKDVAIGTEDDAPAQDASGGDAPVEDDDASAEDAIDGDLEEQSVEV